MKGVFIAALLFLLASPATAATGKLNATVADPVTITLKSNGQKVKSQIGRAHV